MMGIVPQVLERGRPQTTVGKSVGDAMVAIERDNPRFKGVLPKDYARPGLDKQGLGELIDVIVTIKLCPTQFGKSAKLQRAIQANLTRLGDGE